MSLPPAVEGPSGNPEGWALYPAPAVGSAPAGPGKGAEALHSPLPFPSEVNQGTILAESYPASTWTEVGFSSDVAARCYHPEDWGLFPLAGFAPLPGPGNLDPFNLGVNWPLDSSGVDPVWPGVYAEPVWIAARLGWWGISNSGSPTKVGEWQDLDSSLFWDIDGLHTNGIRTWNFYASGFDEEANQARMQYYGPRMRADVDFQRFLHRLDHDPLSNFLDRPLPANPRRAVNPGGVNAYKRDLNVGDDYAFRVEQLSAETVNYLTDNIKLRVQFFSMRKFGDRQARAIAHCFTERGVAGRNCHVLSQSQQIDWLTTEVTPRLEGRFGPVTIEYARLMRQFSQDDQVVTRDYTGLAPQIIVGNFPYAFVPEFTTQMDQLRLNVDVAEKTKLYAFAYAGHLDNHTRDIQRNLYGYDLRLTDYSMSGLLMTAYSKGYYQDGNTPDTLLPDETQFLTPEQARANIRNPIEYQRTTLGVRSRYQPHLSAPLFRRLALTGGYEYDVLGRNNAVYEQSDEAFTFSQPDTTTHTFHIGVQQPWSTTVDSYTRYRVEFIDDPLFGFRETSGVLNSGLPQQRHIVELGGGWYPLTNFGVSGRQEFDLGWLRADISEVPGNLPRFDEQSYSTNATVWYAPTHKLSLMTSASFMSNWIDQNITLGDDYLEPGAPNIGLKPPVTRPWFYGGQNTVLTTRADYRWTDTVRVFAGYEYVRGKNQFDNRGFVDLWPDLDQFSQVFIETHRILAGVDWKPTELLGVYLRYIYFDYHDVKAPFNDGTSHMLLAGLSLVR